jgi:uncharacterized protein YkwD
MTQRPRGRSLSVALSAVLLAVLAATTTPFPVHASTETDAESLVVDLVNSYRVNAGLVPLRRYYKLAAIAGTRAGRMRDSNTLSHTVGGNITTQFSSAGVTWYSYGETIGYSYGSWASGAARDLVRLWMNSPAHRALLMSTKFNYIGVGLAYRSSNGRTYGSVVMTESPDRNGARSWITKTAISGGNDITWTWSGADLRLQTHTAGLRDFDVQYRVGYGSWHTVLNDSTRTSLTLWNKTHGTTYGVRVRATDRRGNIGAWTAEKRVKLP